MSIKIEGLNELRNKMIKVKEKTNDPSIIYKEISVRMWREQMNHFDNATSDEGPWTPLKESTIMRRRHGKGSGSAKILVDTGRLKNSIKYGADRKEAYVKDGVDYGVYHQEGTRNIPQRKFLWMTDYFIGEMKDLFLSMIMSPFKGGKGA